MSEIRKKNGIPNVKNSEHRILQMQLDTIEKKLAKIERQQEKYIDYAVEANTRSKMNTTLFKIFIPIIIGLSCSLGYVGYLIATGG